MKVYITKWWAARGIVEDEGGSVETDEYGVTYYLSELYDALRMGVTAFQSEEAAVSRVRMLAAKKRAALELQIAKIDRDWLGLGDSK